MKQTTNMARVIGQIQTMARKINEKWFNGELNIDECIWTVSNQAKSYGFFTPWNSFKVFDKVSGEREAVQISLDSQTVNRPIEEVVGTMIHEMTHWLNYLHGVKDTSRGNQYHNKRFKEEAEKHGILIDYDPIIGWSITSPSEELIEWIISESFEELRLQEKSYGTVTIGGTAGLGTSGTATPTKPRNNNVKLICPKCGQIARTTNPNHKIGCWACMIEMVEA